MKKFVIATAVAGLMTMPALAEKLTYEFTTDEGSVSVWTLDQETMGAVSGDITTTYTWDPESKTMCAAVKGEKHCATLAEVKEAPAVGDTTTFTTNHGPFGTVKLIAIE